MPRCNERYAACKMVAQSCEILDLDNHESGIVDQLCNIASTRSGSVRGLRETGLSYLPPCAFTYSGVAIMRLDAGRSLEFVVR